MLVFDQVFDQDSASCATTPRNVSAFSWIMPVEASEPWYGGTEGGCYVVGFCVYGSTTWLAGS